MAGYFDDSSMLRRVHRERALALAGPRALLMQAAHPLAVSGLLAHSSAADDPYERLARTANVMGTIGFGERADADRVTRTVRAMHRRVRGKLREPSGERGSKFSSFELPTGKMSPLVVNQSSFLPGFRSRNHWR